MAIKHKRSASMRFHGWTESERYACVRERGRMDPNLPATKRFLAVAQMLWGRAVETMTPEQFDEMDRKIEENRQLRRLMYGGRVRPIICWETQRKWIEQFGLSPVIGYELDDPC